jgi:transcriptional regulator with XRE-family HTH domain
MAWTDRSPEDAVTQAGLDAIGRVVRDLRQSRRLSQRDLQAISGVHQTTISRIENGRQAGVRWSRFARLIGAMSTPGDLQPQDRDRCR